jgi:hypothetical protein
MMEIQPGIENLNEKKLIGKRLEMSLANNRTGELWAGLCLTESLSEMQSPMT